MFNMDNGRTLAFTGDENVQYAEFTSGTEVMSIIFRLSRGLNALIHPTLLIFTKKNINYHLRCVSDNLQVV